MHSIVRVSVLLALGIALHGCASLETPSPSRWLTVGQGKKLPLKAAVVLPRKMEAVTYTTVAKEPGFVPGKIFPDSYVLVDKTIIIRVGQSSINLLRDMLPRLIETVDFLPSDTGDLSRYQLILFPDLTHLEASHRIVQTKCGPTTAARAQITYEVIAKDNSGTELFTVSGTGTEEDEGQTFVFISSCFPAYPQPVLYYAFEKALAKALAAVYSEIQHNPTFLSFLTAEKEKQTLAADLVAEARFDDSQALLPNNSLDAGEQAELTVTLTNQGAGSAFGVVLAVSADQPHVTISEPKELGEIPPGQKRDIPLPVKAGLELPDGEAKFLIEVHEKRGYDARKVKLVVPTARLNPPSFSITKPEVIGKLANGEKIELVAHVKNMGPGLAAGATLAVTTADPGIELIQSKTTLGTIAQNQSARGAVELAIPRTYSGDSLNLALKVSDGRGDGVASAILPVKLEVKQQKPALDAKIRLLRSGQEVQELENDQTVDVEITPRNDGDLDAEQVSIRFQAANPGVKLQPDRAEVGDLKRNAKASPLRLELTLPRGLTDERLALSVELSQKDFETRTIEFKRPVNVKQPVLVWKQTVRGRRGGSAIEQNETAELEVQIDNTGKLPATGVEAKIDVSIPGVTVQGSSTFSISKIEPSERTVAPFKLRVHRSVPPGVLSIPLLISQADFPPIQATLRVEKTSPPPTPPSLAQRPLIELISPSRGETLRQERVELRATLIDVKGVEYVQVEINGQMVPQETVRSGRSIRPRIQESDWEVSDLKVPLRLNLGVNAITVRVYNKSRQDSETSLKVTRLEGQAPLQLITSTPVHYSNSWALVIGINAYKKRPLRYAVSDALAVEGSLRDLGFQSIRVLLDGEATKQQIEEILYREFPEKGMGPHDRLFVFFAGHGLTGKTKSGEEGFLLPVDGDPVNLPLTAIPMEEVRRIGDRVEARHVLFVLDTCFSGFALTEDATPPGTTEEAAAEKPVVQVLTAGRSGEEAIEKDGFGLFTRRFLDALRSLAQQRGVLTATELGKWTKTRVMEDSNGRMTPQYGRLSGKGDFQFSWPKR